MWVNVIAMGPKCSPLTFPTHSFLSSGVRGLETDDKGVILMQFAKLEVGIKFDG